MAWIYRFRSSGRKALLGSAALALVSCGGGPPPDLGPAPDLILNGVIEANQDLNPDPWNRPSPVVTRIYYLREASAFEQAEFFPLYDMEAEVLGQTLIASEELVIHPGENREYKSTIDPEARYVGVMAAFRDIEHARWRALMELSEENKILLAEEGYALKIDLGRAAVAVSIEEHE